jgi:pimeloyl-ACP methyl ester carboxylesterase
MPDELRDTEARSKKGSRFFRWLKRAFVGLAIAVILLLGTGFVYQRIADYYDAKKLPHSGELIDAGGHLQYIHCTGQGSPTVILESGGGMVSYTWEAVQHEVAKFAKCCSYDRAGYGLSETGTKPRTAGRIAVELHTLLQNAKIPGPYVLVGHSLGGLNIRMFAELYPDEVAGLVFVDSSSEDQYERMPPEMQGAMEKQKNLISLLRIGSQFGAVRLFMWLSPQKDPEWANAEPEAFRAQMLHSSLRPAVETAISEISSFQQSGQEVKGCRSLGNRPVIVLTQGKPVEASEAPDGVPLESVQQFMNTWRDELQPALARLSTRGEQRIVVKSGHMIPMEDPPSVVAAIRDVIDRIQTSR